MLAPDQIKRFRDDGFMPLPGLFAFDEIAWLRDEARVVALRHARADAARAWVEEAPEGTIYGAHLDEPSFAKLAGHPRILRIVHQVLGEPGYVHQTRLLPWRTNAPGDGLWRRDAAVWAALDGLPAAGRAVTATVLLEDDAYGPALHVMPASHRPDSPGAPRLVGVGGGLGSVVLYDANLNYAFGRAGERPHPRLFLISFNAVTSPPAAARGAPYTAARVEPPAEEVDDCLWPAPWCAAG